MYTGYDKFEQKCSASLAKQFKRKIFCYICQNLISKITLLFRSVINKSSDLFTIKLSLQNRE